MSTRECPLMCPGIGPEMTAEKEKKKKPVLLFLQKALSAWWSRGKGGCPGVKGETPSGIRTGSRREEDG